ncbi:MAG: glycosyltransferase family 2 protein [Pseudomonadota bacterium]
MRLAKGAQGEQLLSIVVPCYNEEAVVDATLPRLIEECDKLDNIKAEVICVDDGSRDKTLELLADWAMQDDRIKVIALSRNFGHQIAVTAGVDAALGDAVVIIDADLQDPPELIHEMVARWRAGDDVVYGRRKERPGETPFKLATARAFYRVLNKLSEIPIPLDTGDFRLIDRHVVEALKDMPERDRFLRGMVSWVGYRQSALEYVRAERFAGETKYPLRKMIRFASDGIFSFSRRPLQLSIALGVTASGLALLGIIYALALRLFTDVWVEGWTALFIAVMFFGGVQLLCIGIMGEYVGRIYQETKNRPLYFIKQRLGGPTPRREVPKEPLRAAE